MKKLLTILFADTDLKQRMIGSIFSEKLCFDGKKYRTVPLNPAIELMVSNIKPFKKAQKKQASKKRDLSRIAPLPGLISNQVYEGFAQLYELRTFMEYDGNNGMNAQC